MYRKMFPGFLSIRWPFNAAILSILLMASFGLEGCTALSNALQSNTTKTIEETCTAVGGAVQVLAIAEHQGKLNTTTVNAVDSLIAVTEPICTAQTAPSLSSAELTVFTQAATQLATYSVEYGSNGTGVLK